MESTTTTTNDETLSVVEQNDACITTYFRRNGDSLGLALLALMCWCIHYAVFNFSGDVQFLGQAWLFTLLWFAFLGYHLVASFCECLKFIVLKFVSCCGGF